jgi:hypothetical protein
VFIEHSLRLSWFSARSESHEQDGEMLPLAIAKRRATASGDPAMAFRTLPGLPERTLFVRSLTPAARFAAGQMSECPNGNRFTERAGEFPRAKI